jgi:ferritin-like metal-binding protein YciE
VVLLISVYLCFGFDVSIDFSLALVARGRSNFMKPLERVFWDEIGELLHVEELLLKSLPKMKEAATADNLKAALDDYREAVQLGAKRVRDVFQLYEVPPREKKCDAMMGLLTRGQQLMQRSGPGAALDASLVVQARKIIGYKIAAYEAVSDWARQLHAKEVAKTLDKSLKAETENATEFQDLAPDCNAEAAKQSEESARKPIARVPRRSKEFAEGGSRWGDF